MNSVPGFGAVPASWGVEKARRILTRKRRAVRPNDAVVTAFRDGQVTLRSNRRLDGFTEALQEIGYQGIRRGDLVVHAMDAFAGAIGISDSDGKSSPAVHAYVGRSDVDLRYISYALRSLAWSGYVASLARGIRERSTAFDPASLADVNLPVPPLAEQHRIADYLDHQLQKIDEAVAAHQSLAALARSRLHAYVDQELMSVENFAPLRYLVRYKEGPGIMADDFRDSGTPLVRVSGLRTRSASLQGCNFLDESKARSTWRKFRLQLGDYLLSASASTGQVSVVDSALVVGAIPYTGIIILRPAKQAIYMPYIEALLASSVFLNQIDQLKAGMGMQHFGPTHLAQVRVPSANLSTQKRIGDTYVYFLNKADELSTNARAAITLLQERRVSLIAAAVSGQMDVSTAPAFMGKVTTR